MCVQASGQSPLTSRFQELVRLQQLAQYDSSVASNLMMPDASIAFRAKSNKRQFTSSWSKGNLTASLVPASVTIHHNSKLPYEWNLGALVPAKGGQLLASAGVRLQWKNCLELRLQPEWLSAQNKPFEMMSQELNPQLWRDYFRFYYNITDIPERMDGAPYRKLYPGQSSLRFSKGAFTYAISSENKWWGPGYRNALVLSSNAPGFVHLSAETRRPLQTRWGRIEGELLAGTLAESGVMPPRRYTAFDGQFLYPNKNTANRYLSALTINWQPKWTPGLYLGFAKASYLYPSDIRSPLDVLPLQGVLGKKLTGAERSGRKASLGSFFLRYVLPEERAEAYLEYGRPDRATMPWNVFSAKAQRTGFVAGFNKLVKAGNGFVRLGAEITQLQAGDTALIMQPGSWYTHNYVQQGYTHMGRSLGAGIGPGSNAQSLFIDWVKEGKRVGIQLERLRHNGDYYYAAMTYLGDFRRHWVQIGATLKADWDFGPISLHGNLGMIRSLNHQWVVVEARPNYFFAAGNEYLNIASQLSARYRF